MDVNNVVYFDSIIPGIDVCWEKKDGEGTVVIIKQKNNKIIIASMHAIKVAEILLRHGLEAINEDAANNCLPTLPGTDEW